MIDYAKEIYNEILSHGPSMREIFEYSNQVQNNLIYAETDLINEKYFMTFLYQIKPATIDCDIIIFTSIGKRHWHSETNFYENSNGKARKPNACFDTVFSVALLIKLDENKEAYEIKINDNWDANTRLDIKEKDSYNPSSFSEYISSYDTIGLDLFLYELRLFYQSINITKDMLSPWSWSAVVFDKDDNNTIYS